MTAMSAPFPGNLPPGYEIKRKKPFYKKIKFWLFLIVLAIIIGVIAGLSSAAKDAVSKPHTVTYKITGTIKRADIDYNTDDGSNVSVSRTIKNHALPWTKTVTVKGDLSDFSVTGTASDLTDQGTVACTLTVDGKVVASDSGSSVALCAGSPS